MTSKSKNRSGELFIVDNSDKHWKVARYLNEWSSIARQLDVATGYFEIGGLLAIGENWQSTDKIRILMGDEVSRRTKRAFQEAQRLFTSKLDESIESHKFDDDFLSGVPAILLGLRNKQIECRVYRNDKFHAKAYITHARSNVVGSFALVGSSNLTHPGLTQNVELNVRISGPEVSLLQDWYEEHWDSAEDVNPHIIRVIEKHVREYSPFEVFAQSLHHLFHDTPSDAKNWEEKSKEEGGSEVFKQLGKYQQDGYRNLIEIAQKYNGAFLCDGVGLGKTFIGMMLLERLVKYDRKNVVLIVPKAAREAVWVSTIEQYCPDLLDPSFNRLQIINHTDITRVKTTDVDWPRMMETIRQKADAVVIDEAHHFRNPGVQVDVDSENPSRLIAKDGRNPSRYRRLYHMLEGSDGVKEVFLLTATPVNNHINDFRHMVELFTRKDDNHFGPQLGIQSLRGHFLKLDKAIEKKASEHGNEGELFSDNQEVEDILVDDMLFSEIVVQRSRSFVRESQLLELGEAAIFPDREKPQVANYNIRKTYGTLLESVEKAFAKKNPLFRLAIYNPAAYAKKTDETREGKIEANRQTQVIGLVRTNFLKRFESSAKSFEASCERLMIKMLAWIKAHAKDDHEKDRIAKWEHKYEKLLGIVDQHQQLTDRHQHDLFSGDEIPEEDLIPPEMIEEVAVVNDKEYNVGAMIADTIDDLDELSEFLNQLQKFDARHDDKLQSLIKLLKKDKELKGKKVLIFTEFADTANYLAKHLKAAEVEGVAHISGETSTDGRLAVIRRFSPYYNGVDSKHAQENGGEIRVLISTDVLSEGLNLQDATRMINYDLHWNPVRLMQRIGRVDRRMNPQTEEKLLADHPDAERGRILFWNFIPPDDLDDLLKLYKRVSHKTLRISSVFGIEGKQLLTEDDDFEALKDFNKDYEGKTTRMEKLRLEYQKLLKNDPELTARLDALPGRLFSGRAVEDETRLAEGALFCCYSLPARDLSVPQDSPLFEQWTEQAGVVRWYLLDHATGEIHESAPEIAGAIRSDPDTERRSVATPKTLVDARKVIEKHIDRTYMRSCDAPAGVKPRLVAWMELNNG